MGDGDGAGGDVGARGVVGLEAGVRALLVGHEVQIQIAVVRHRALVGELAGLHPEPGVGAAVLGAHAGEDAVGQLARVEELRRTHAFVLRDPGDLALPIQGPGQVARAELHPLIVLHDAPVGIGELDALQVHPSPVDQIAAVREGGGSQTDIGLFTACDPPVGGTALCPGVLVPGSEVVPVLPGLGFAVHGYEGIDLLETGLGVDVQVCPVEDGPAVRHAAAVDAEVAVIVQRAKIEQGAGQLFVFQDRGCVFAVPEPLLRAGIDIHVDPVLDRALVHKAAAADVQIAEAADQAAVVQHRGGVSVDLRAGTVRRAGQLQGAAVAQGSAVELKPADVPVALGLGLIGFQPDLAPVVQAALHIEGTGEVQAAVVDQGDILADPILAGQIQIYAAVHSHGGLLARGPEGKPRHVKGPMDANIARQDCAVLIDAKGSLLPELHGAAGGVAAGALPVNGDRAHAAVQDDVAAAQGAGVQREVRADKEGRIIEVDRAEAVSEVQVPVELEAVILAVEAGEAEHRLFVKRAVLTPAAAETDYVQAFLSVVGAGEHAVGRVCAVVKL